MQSIQRRMGWASAATFFSAAVMAAGLSFGTAPAQAAFELPEGEKITNVPAIPRAIPQKEAYELYDPKIGKNFDIKNFWIRADLRVRPEMRNGVCFGGGSLTRDERALAASLGLHADHIVQLGGADELLAAAYRNAVALVYPSHYEGFGLPPLEAMSASCPVLSSNTSSLPEVVGDAGISFDPKQHDAIGEAMEQVAFSDELRRALIARGHEQRSKFTWRRCVEDTLNGYRKID